MKEPEIKSYVVTIYNRSSSVGESAKRVIKAFNAEDAIAQAKLLYDVDPGGLLCVDKWEVGKIEPYSPICECGHEKRGHTSSGMPFDDGYRCQFHQGKATNCPCPSNPNNL